MTMGLFSRRPDHVPPEPREPRPDGSQKGVVRRDHQIGPLNFSDGARRTRSMIFTNKDRRPPVRWWE